MGRMWKEEEEEEEEEGGKAVVKKQENQRKGIIKGLGESRARVYHQVVGCENRSVIHGVIKRM